MYNNAEAALKEQINNLNQAKAQQSYYGDVGAQTPNTGAALGRAARVPLREQLEKRSAGMHEQHDRVARALDILKRHPEFEEFLQLQELINSGLYY